MYVGDDDTTGRLRSGSYRVLHPDIEVSGNVGSSITPPGENAVSATRISKVTINLLIAELASKDGIVCEGTSAACSIWY